MALLLRDLTLDVSEDEQTLPHVAATFLGIDAGSLSHFRVVRRSIDARKKSRILKVYSVEFSCPDEEGMIARVASQRLEKLPEQAEVVLLRRRAHRPTR